MKKIILFSLILILIIGNLNVGAKEKIKHDLFLGVSNYQYLSLNNIKKIKNDYNEDIKNYDNVQEMKLDDSLIGKFGYTNYLFDSINLNLNFNYGQKLSGKGSYVHQTTEGDINEDNLETKIIERGNKNIELLSNNLSGNIIYSYNDYISLLAGLSYYFGSYEEKREDIKEKITKIVVEENGESVIIEEKEIIDSDIKNKKNNLNEVGYQIGTHLHYPVLEDTKVTVGFTYRNVTAELIDDIRQSLSGFEYSFGLIILF